MAKNISIIDHRNIRALYISWTLIVIGVLGAAVVVYYLQYTTPFISDKNFLTLYILFGLSLVVAILAGLFKFLFKREVIAWVFTGSIALAGFALFLIYGWHWGFAGFFGFALVLLVILGPYLYFD